MKKGLDDWLKRNDDFVCTICACLIVSVIVATIILIHRVFGLAPWISALFGVPLGFIIGFILMLLCGYLLTKITKNR